MQSLLEQPAIEQLQLPDADITFWQQPDLAIQPQQLLQHLIDATEWRQEQITVYGKPHLQPRLSAWFGDLSYTYSGIELTPAPWTNQLRELKNRIEALTGLPFNSVLLNYYRDNNDSMGMHSDDESSLGPQPAIASLSLGEQRTFLLKHKFRKELTTFKLPLPSASLLLMKGDTQANWRHGINKEKQGCGARINLTFRNILRHL